MNGAPERAETNLASDIAEIKQDVEQILPALVDALKRNRYFDEMEKQLRRAQDVAAVWRDWPLVVGVHDVLLAMRSAPDSDPAMVEQLSDVLHRTTGVEEFGLPGEEIDPTTAEISSSTGAGSLLVVEECQRPGLRIGHHLIRKAIVSVTRQGEHA